MNVISLTTSPLLAMACGMLNVRVFLIKCPECGHTFVFNASFSHTLSPRGLTGNKLVKFLIERLKPEEKISIKSIKRG